MQSAGLPADAVQLHMKVHKMTDSLFILQCPDRRHMLAIVRSICVQ